jgi:hypothetical protein
MGAQLSASVLCPGLINTRSSRRAQPLGGIRREDRHHFGTAQRCRSSPPSSRRRSSSYPPEIVADTSRGDPERPVSTSSRRNRDPRPRRCADDRHHRTPEPGSRDPDSGNQLHDDARRRTIDRSRPSRSTPRFARRHMNERRPQSHTSDDERSAVSSPTLRRIPSTDGGVSAAGWSLRTPTTPPRHLGCVTVERDDTPTTAGTRA